MNGLFRCLPVACLLLRPDEQVLADLAALFGGPPELLVPAWSCLQLGLDRLPAELAHSIVAVQGAGLVIRDVGVPIVTRQHLFRLLLPQRAVLNERTDAGRR